MSEFLRQLVFGFNGRSRSSCRWSTADARVCTYALGTTQVYMGGELDEKPKHGLVTQTLAKIVMSVVKQVRAAS